MFSHFLVKLVLNPNMKVAEGKVKKKTEVLNEKASLHNAMILKKQTYLFMVFSTSKSIIKA